MADSIVSFFQWILEAIGSLTSPALAIGQILTIFIFFALPGLFIYAVVRFALQVTENVLGQTDAVLTAFFFAVVIGGVFGGLFLDSWRQGPLHLAVSGLLWLSSAAGLFFSGSPIFGRWNSIWLALFMSGVALVCACYAAI